jgi:FkbM family methyltransferase
MDSYRKNKLGTAWEITRKIENWPTAWGLRLFRKRAGLRLLKLRKGLQVVCRGNSRDWDVFHELFFAGGYEAALRYLANLSGAPKVLDLGGNIGLFALLAARSHPLANIFSYEPGPPNARLFEVNRLLNPELMDRIALSQAAVGAQDRVAEWYFDEKNPGGSGFFAGGNHRFPVTVHAFDRIVESLANPLDLVKMDIEGAEYEVFLKSPPQTWKKIKAVALELHEDPQGLIPRERCLEVIRRLGFQVKEESVISLFLYR